MLADHAFDPATPGFVGATVELPLGPAAPGIVGATTELPPGAAAPGIVGATTGRPLDWAVTGKRLALRHGFLTVRSPRWAAVSGPPSPGLEASIARMEEDLAAAT